MEKSESKVQEISFIEQNLQGMLFEKQAIDIERSEVDSAIEEIKKSEEKVFKIVGNILVATDKEKVLQELEEKKKLLEFQLNTLEKQEEIFSKKITELRKEVVK